MTMKTFLMPLRNAAQKYKLPIDWLEAQARSGKISALIADQPIMFDERKLLRELHRKIEKQTEPGRIANG